MLSANFFSLSNVTNFEIASKLSGTCLETKVIHKPKQSIDNDIKLESVILLIVFVRCSNTITPMSSNLLNYDILFTFF